MQNLLIRRIVLIPLSPRTQDTSNNTLQKRSGRQYILQLHKLLTPSKPGYIPRRLRTNAPKQCKTALVKHDYPRGFLIPHLHTPLPPIIKLPRELPPLPVIAVLKRTASLPTIPFSLLLPSPNVVLR